jgi:hypothetical protein
MNNQQLDGVAVRLKALERDVDRLKALDRPNATALLRGNYLINGSFKVNQRYVATARTLPVATVDYTLDQVRCNVNGTGPVVAVSQQAHAVGGDGIPGAPTNFLRWNQTTAGSGSTQATVGLVVENVNTLSGQLVTFSAWMKADTNGRQVTMDIQQFFGGGGGGSATVSNLGTIQTLTTSWARYSATGFVSDVTGSSRGASLNDCLICRFSFPLNVIQTIDVSQTQLEPGGAPTNFRFRTFDEEYVLCRRYYQKSFIYGTVPATGVRAGSFEWGAFKAGAVLQQSPYLTLPTPMRATPTVVLYNPVTAASAQIHNYTTVGDFTGSAAAAANATEKGFIFAGTGVVAQAVGDVCGVQWTAEANIV